MIPLRSAVNNKSLNIIIIFGFYMSLVGCNITYKVRNQYNDIEHIEHTPCGTICIELIGKGNSVFTFRQRFDLDAEVNVNIDSLQIYCNRWQIDLKHDLKNYPENSGWTSLDKKKNWEASFKLENGVFEGDTIIVFGNNYLKCHGENISLDTMVYSFVNNLRIRGVNDFK